MRKLVRIGSASTGLLVGLVLISCPGLAAADPDFRIAEFADVPPVGPGGTLTSTALPIQIAPSTKVESATGPPVTLTDGDRVKMDAVIADGVIRATKLELEEFPEIEVRGTASDLPAAGVTLPLPAGTTIGFRSTPVLWSAGLS